MKICFVRLDLNNFVLNQPVTTTGVCQVDTFKINSGSVSGNLVPAVPAAALCGTNTGQHSKLIGCRIG